MPPAIPSKALPSGAQIPQLGFGTWQVPQADAVEVVTHALDAGYRHIDTAAAYGNEAQVGQAIRAAGLAREDVFLTTKLWNRDHGKDQAKAALRASLDRLEVDFVDLYLIHWPVPSRDLFVETWAALVELQQDGLARDVGVSNFQPAHLDRIIEATGVTPAVNQVELHPRLQQPGLRRDHDERGILTEAWSPLAQGQVLDDPALASIAERHGRSVGQVVLAWHLRLGNVVFPKSVTPARIRENIDVLDIELSEEDVAAIAALDAGVRVGPDPDTFAVT